jgi:hypothetical protein
MVQKTKNAGLGIEAAAAKISMKSRIHQWTSQNKSSYKE